MALCADVNTRTNGNCRDKSAVAVGGSLQENEAFEDINLNESSGEVGYVYSGLPDCDTPGVQATVASTGECGAQRQPRVSWAPSAPVAPEGYHPDDTQILQEQKLPPRPTFPQSKPPAAATDAKVWEAPDSHIIHMDELTGQSSTDGASLMAKSAELVDKRNSISMRSQAYASMAVVAALIAGISVTFLVEVDYTFAENDSTTYILLQVAVAGCLVVCFLSLYGTTVLSMQYYLVTRALGHVPSTDVVEQQRVLDEVMAFMANTRWVRHTAVKCVIISVPIFTVIVAVFGMAKSGAGPIGYGALGLGGIAFVFFVHAIVAQQQAFSGKQEAAKEFVAPVGLPTHRKGRISFNTAEKPQLKRGGTQGSLRKTAQSLMQKPNQVSNFRLVW
eukprot:m.71798 g.71798  ORF g.71798 m.71798 type:complete len:389 (-) comp16095_c0_seq1:74-1240(-)